MSTALAAMPQMPLTATYRQPKIRQPKPAVTFDEWMIQKTRWIDQENMGEQWARWRKWEEVLKFFIGEQLIYWIGSAENGYFKQVDLEDGDPYYASNIFQPIVNAALAELYRSNGELLVSAKSDQPHQIDAAISAKAGLISEERRVWTDETILRALMFLLLYGNSFWHTTWVPKGGPQVPMPNFNNQQMPFGSQYAYCASCGEQFEAPQEMACPSCGSDALMLDGEQGMMDIPQFGAPEMRDGGDVQLVIPDPMLIKIHLHARFLEESPYLRYDQWMLRDDAEMMYPWADFEQAPRGYQDARNIERMYETHPGNMTGMGDFGKHAIYRQVQAEDKEMVLARRYWLRPSQYWQVTLSEDREFDNGLFLPAGIRLRDAFPKGMYLVKNGDGVIDIDKNRTIDGEWTHVRFQTIPNRIWGDGMEGLVQGQREYNEIRSAELENDFHNATPATIINSKKIKGNVSGKARAVYSIDNAQKDDMPQNFYWQPPPRNLGPDMPMQKQNIKGDMQLIANAPIGGESGIEGASSSTATGMQIIRDWINSKNAIRIGPLNAAKVKRAKQHLKFMQDYWTGPRFVKLSNQTGMDDGKWFQSADIQGDFDITLKPGSWQPRSALEMKDNMLQLLVAGGVPFGTFNPSFPKQAAVVLTRELGFPMDIDGYSMHVRKQRDEIDYIKEAIGMAGQVGLDPVMLTSVAVPVEETDEDGAHIEAINYYLNTDMGRKEPPEVKAAIIAHMHAHEMNQQAKQMRKMALAGPLVLAGMQQGAGGPQMGSPMGAPDKTAGANEGSPQ